MTHTQPATDLASTASPSRVDMKLEVVVIPVSDIDSAKEFTAGSAGASTLTLPLGTISA
jgi:hypothetical protein